MGKLSSNYPDSEAVEQALDRANWAEVEIEDIKRRLDDLEYREMTINSFTASPSFCEMGGSYTIDLAWSLNKSPLSQTLNGVEVEGLSAQFSDVTEDATYTLTVSDDHRTVSDTVNVSFANQIYWGVAENLSNVTSLSRVLSNDPERTIAVNAGSNKYIIYALPKRLGAVTFFVGGFEGGFESPAEQTLTNESGYSEVYRVYRSTNPNLGTTIIEVREV